MPVVDLVVRPEELEWVAGDFCDFLLERVELQLELAAVDEQERTGRS